MKEYTPEELKEIKDNDDVIVLDVREDWEYEEDNITGHNISLHDIPGQMEDIKDEWQDKEVVTYCNTGQNSLMASNLLEQAGFERVGHLQGGIDAWNEVFNK